MTCEAESEGKRCEEMFEEVCVSLGYGVVRCPTHFMAWDLAVDGTRVQVKKRTTTPSNRYSIELKTSARGKAFAYKASDVDSFGILLDGSWFVVPSTAIARDDGTIPNKVKICEIIPFRDAWHILKGGRHVTERQLGFDF